MTWETVIGLETHVELSTKTKIFCSCSTAFGGDPNTRCCPVCTGMPGALPVMNRAVMRYAVRAGLALNCQIARSHRFDRKNYFYPDLPKAYQISQLYLPIAVNGSLPIRLPSGTEKVIRIHEMHMEEDAGKLMHDLLTRRSRADYNRCGVPLIEIVTEPDFRNAEEVITYLEKLKSTLEYLGISDCKMQEGSLRCDVNLSVRPAGSNILGTRTEMKNLNSFRAVTRAIAYESRRQIELIETGMQVVQETRRWDEDRNVSFPMRSKEDAQDYRYFPEPDIPPMEITEEYLQDTRASLPEMAEARKERYISQFGLPVYDADMLTSQKALADFFERAVDLGGIPGEVAHWIMGEVLRTLKERPQEAADIPLKPETLVALLQLIKDGRINRSTAVEVFDAIFDTNADPEAYVREHGLEQISDVSLVESIVLNVLAENPKSADDYRSGKQKAFGFLVGQTMRALQGKGDPKTVNRLLHEKLISSDKK